MADDLFNSFMNGPDENGRFGDFGGRFVSETLMPLILELEEQYYALIHEIGHAVLYTTREEPEDVVLLETLAWCAGLKIVNKLGLLVNEKKFREQMIHAINLYNDRSNDDS